VEDGFRDSQSKATTNDFLGVSVTYGGQRVHWRSFTADTSYSWALGLECPLVIRYTTKL